MQHDRARELLSRGRRTGAVEIHLRDCPECRAHAEALDTVLRHAPTMVPSAPAELRDRVLASVDHTGSTATTAPAERGTATVTRLSERRSPRWATWGAAATAAAAVAIGVVWFGPITAPADEPAQVLAAAVSRAQSGPGANAFRFDVTGSAVVPLPQSPADPTDAALGAPAADRGRTSRTRSAPSVRTTGLQLPPLEIPRLDPPSIQLPSPPTMEFPPLELPSGDLLEELSLEGLCSGFALTCVTDGDGVPVPTAADYVSAFRRLGTEVGGEARRAFLARLHLQLELGRLGVHPGAAADADGELIELRFDGAGRSDGALASTYALRWQLLHPVAADGSLEVTAEGDRTWVRTDGAGPWVANPDVGGFHLAGAEAVHGLDDALDRLAHHGGPVSELPDTILRETEVRRFALRTGAMSVEAWVGRHDGLLHRIAVEHGATASPGSAPAIRTVFDLHDHGAEVDVQSPSEAVPLAQVPVSALPPFWLDLDAAVVADEY